MKSTLDSPTKVVELVGISDNKRIADIRWVTCLKPESRLTLEP